MKSDANTAAVDVAGRDARRRGNVQILGVVVPLRVIGEFESVPDFKSAHVARRVEHAILALQFLYARAGIIAGAVLALFLAGYVYAFGGIVVNLQIAESVRARVGGSALDCSRAEEIVILEKIIARLDRGCRSPLVDIVLVRDLVQITARVKFYFCASRTCRV